ncbi:hypothetical protein [Rubripirellula obstinata]|uniref:hypothetical protein n=1 Tax=Rubripirellula obstinata TaxID=406547 RepID=UPI001F41BF1B|nr:hypothetical protein [Rubripirellula obstinata]
MTFRSSVMEHSDTIKAIGDIPEIELGDAAGSKLAIMIDSATKRRDQQIWNTLQQLPGVTDLAVAMVAFDGELPIGSNPDDEKTNGKNDRTRDQS